MHAWMDRFKRGRGIGKEKGGKAMKERKSESQYTSGLLDNKLHFVTN